MTNIEKVIKGLTICYEPPAKCEDCPYHNLPDEQSCNDVLCLDALELLKEQVELGTELTNAVELIHKKNERIKKLLKEQEAVEPTFKQDEDGIFVWACGSCGAYMYHIYDGIDKAKEYAKYCRQCGRKVKWND